MAGGMRKVPSPPTDDEVRMMRLIGNEDGTLFRFESKKELAEFKFQRYMQRYLRTVQSIDDNVGRIFELLDSDPELADNTNAIYTSDQGFFLGEHGWFDKRFIYEESFQMPLMIRYPKEIEAGSVCSDIVCNVDFSPTLLDFAGITTPTYMQGRTFRSILGGNSPADWDQLAYHRYWMRNDTEHEAYAHYGVRNHRYKLIYWHYDDLLVDGARPGGEDCRKCELFDCQEDALELFNCYADPKYGEVVIEMTRLLEWKMMEIGDEPAREKLAGQ
ncbi:hypothetical protein N7519_000009 [Penicillium mononematosum]|uniref:uncharacterized protein n=1 Tax=Penicillium mononematosum TaxID=268346 RepID=UPI00254750CA|nr:uncharacterized protein N7519_000009 [Penicillium mononematosum]KAJ6189988.1 hypothetical protein N7519_000009 [Penicillium mononematosum]